MKMVQLCLSLTQIIKFVMGKEGMVIHNLSSFQLLHFLLRTFMAPSGLGSRQRDIQNKERFFLNELFGDCHQWGYLTWAVSLGKLLAINPPVLTFWQSVGVASAFQIGLKGVYI